MFVHHIKLQFTFLFIVLGYGSVSHLAAQSKIQMQFRKDHTFKIAQFTDIHWDNTSPKCSSSSETIHKVITNEKPDLAILTGDVVTASPAREGWLAVAKIFEETKTPWAVILGNHDAEPDITRDQIFDLIANLPFFVGTKGPELYGCGNYAIPVIASSGKSIAAILYCLDSNDYPNDKKAGHYDWIHFDQIAWYRATSDQFTAANHQLPIPSLAFFHIPLMEYNDVEKETMVGVKKEEVSSADINSGLFASMIEKKDVMGIFTGHDHDNNYIGINHDIALAYGQVTGADAPYGQLERGSRIIEMKEGEFSFGTWISFPSGIQFKYHYPSGLASDESNIEYLPAIHQSGLKQGVSYKYFEKRFKSTDDLGTAKVTKTGIVKNISLDPAAARDSFAFEFNAWIKIPQKAVYRFYTYSDDGSKLFIDGKEVVNNDGSHSARRADGKIALEEGFHEFKLLYFEDYMGNKLEVGFSSINIRECTIPDHLLFTK